MGLGPGPARWFLMSPEVLWLPPWQQTEFQHALDLPHIQPSIQLIYAVVLSFISLVFVLIHHFIIPFPFVIKAQGCSWCEKTCNKTQRKLTVRIAANRKPQIIKAKKQLKITLSPWRRPTGKRKFFIQQEKSSVSLTLLQKRAIHLLVPNWISDSGGPY